MKRYSSGWVIKACVAYVMFSLAAFAHAGLAVDELAFRTHYGAADNQLRNLGLIGQLYSIGGVPATGTFDVEIGVWDSMTGGTQLGTESFSNVPVVAGNFSAHTPVSFAFDGVDIRQSFLSLSFNGTEVGRIAPNRANDNFSGGGFEVRAFATASSFLDYTLSGPSGTLDSGPGSRSLKIGGRVTGAGNQLNNLTVRVYDGPTGGTAQLEETFGSVEVTRGQFSLDVAELSPSVGDVLSSGDTSN